MDRERIARIIAAFMELALITPEKQDELITKLLTMEEKEGLKYICNAVYRLFSTDEEKYSKALSIVADEFSEYDFTVDDLKNRLFKLYNNEIEGNMSMEDNHELVIRDLKEVTKLLNAVHADYYVVGALPCFLKVGEPLFRYHDDIDIMVNEKDLEKVNEIIELMGYKFQDDRFPSKERYEEMLQNKPPHTVLAQNPDNEFHIGFFTFKRSRDKTIVMREYMHRLDKGKVVVDVLERHYNDDSLRYDDTPFKYEDTEFKTPTVEHVYNLKRYTSRSKDIADNKILSKYIDEEKLDKLKENKTININILNVKKDSIKKINGLSI